MIMSVARIGCAAYCESLHTGNHAWWNEQGVMLDRVSRVSKENRVSRVSRVNRVSKVDRGG